MTPHMTPQYRVLRRRDILVAAGAILAGMSSRAQPAGAAGLPQGPMRLIVPFPAGTGADMVARAFAKAIGDLRAQPVVVDNKAGANGIIAVQAALQAPADGLTLLLGSNSALSSNAALLRNLPYDPVRDFSPIGVTGRAPCVVIVSPKSPYASLKDLLADARRRPGALNFGSASPSYALYSEWMSELAGIRANNIPYKGTTEVMTAIAGQQLDYAVVDATAAQELIRSGRLRALAVTDEKRMPAIAAVPTSAEAGLPALQAYSWTAFAVSAKTPVATVQALEALVAKAGQSHDVADLFERTSITPMMTTGAAMRRFQVEEIARWKRLAVAAKLVQD